METIKENDFIELEFTGKANNEIFDTTHKEEAKKIGLNVDVKPIVVSVGNEMLLKGLDELLPGKEIGKEYSIKLNPEKAFGKRNASMIKTIPIKAFREKEMNPVPGMTVQMDDYIAKILSVSGGRVIVDFNNPLSGKEIEYDFKILKKVDDEKEKINALQDFFFRKRFDFDINKETKKVVFKEEKLFPFLQVFGAKFKDMTGLTFEIEIKKKKEEGKTEGKEEKEHIHGPNCNHEH